MEPAAVEALMRNLLGMNDEAMMCIREDGFHTISKEGSGWYNREEGRDVPGDSAVTMIGWKRLKNVADLITKALDQNIPGGFIETGVWKGGACILAAHMLHGTDRKVYVCDSFQGCPAPKMKEDEGQYFHNLYHLRVDQDSVKANFARFNTPMDNVVFVPGWFSETLPKVKDTFSVIRLDGDLYESTIVALENLYPQLSPGGACIIDDWCLSPARQATQDFRKKLGYTNDPTPIDHAGVYWVKD